MTWTLKAKTAAAATTTTAVDCTGADLIVAEVSQAFAGGTFSDSSSNVWQQIGPVVSGQVFATLFFCLGPTTSATQTFSFSGSFYAINVTAWSGSAGSGSYDQTANATGVSATSQAAGSITPSVGNSLIIAGLGTDAATSATAISTGTIQENTLFSGGVNEGGAIASFVQSVAAAINPSWSWTGASDAVAIVASFAPAPTINRDFGNGFTVKNASATQGPFALLGGKYVFTASAIFGGGTVALSILGPDGATYITVKSFSAAGTQTLDLPPGEYQVTIATATAVYAGVIPVSNHR
jgi:hypothetical protein